MTRDFSSVISLPPTLETRNVSRRPFAPIRFATCSSIKVTVEPSSRSAWTFIEPSGPYSSTGTIFACAHCINIVYRYRRVLGDDGCRLALPHDPLSWSALGGVAYDVRLDISYRAFLCTWLACDGPQASETHAKPFAASHFSLIFNFTNSPQSGKPCSLLQSGHIIFTFIVDRFDGWKAVCEFELLSSYFIVLIVFVLRGRRSGVGLKFLLPPSLSAWRRCTGRLSYSKVDNITSSGSSLF
ncbi:hypothetical protein EVAR_7521_1 [Eumeta japonica]|uniref:Uncharacterized protein n=1 Tax=Eumeta variegata TaxID=151549 RepID=A0A4C2A6I9_EUMVA|nr:hypothetical protein EVAR_7521_1 [Eumeta japonica]